MIKITTSPTEDPQFGQSKWWGEPDMPETLAYPEALVTEDGDSWTIYEDHLEDVTGYEYKDLTTIDVDPNN